MDYQVKSFFEELAAGEPTIWQSGGQIITKG
jgi:hypothetical protein